MTVYFIKPVGMDGPVKIGCSHRPDGRRSALEAWSPFPLEVAAEIEGGMYLERQFHSLFRDSHSHREWFHPSAELTSVINAIASGTFDVSSLPEPQSLPRQRKPGPRKQWTQEQKDRAKFWRAIKRAEKSSGLTYEWSWSDAEKENFIRDPARFGITRSEREAREKTRLADHYQNIADVARRDAFAAAVKKAGGQTAFAAICGCTQGNIWQLLKKESPLPAQYVLAVESATGVSRHELRPDIYPAPAQADAA